MLRLTDGWRLTCIECGSNFQSDPRTFVCARCGGLLELEAVTHVTKMELFEAPATLSRLWRFRNALPVRSTSRPVSLGEGNTPLLRSLHLGVELGLRQLHIKNEGMNPTGSFKDRGMTVAVTRAVESGAQILVCASTGNTAASVAAYAARAGLKSAVVLPSGKVAAGKLSQAAAHGARLVAVRGTFDRALALTRAALQKLKGLYLLNSLNPYRIEGQKTVSFEVLEQLRFEVPDFVVLPVGNAGNISAVWKGFRELHSWGILKRVPKLIGVQAAGAAPIADAFERHLGVVKPLAEPKTVATAISIGNPISWKKAMNAIKESGGLAVSVSDKEIVRARNDLATKEGIFVEYASATPIAAIRKLRGQVREDDLVVVIATGHGLKDQETVGLETKTIRNAADENSLVKLLSE